MPAEPNASVPNPAALGACLTPLPDRIKLMDAIIAKCRKLGRRRSLARTISVGLSLARHIDPATGWCSPTAAMLASDTAYDERTVRRALKDLRKAGTIETRRKSSSIRGWFAGNQYRFTPAVLRERDGNAEGQKR